VRAAGFIRVYISPPLANGTAGVQRERKRDGEQQAGVVDERPGREEQNDDGARAADTGETRVKDEDTGVARASLARILISSTAHQPLAESRSFAHFISRPAKRGVSWHGMAHLRTYRRRRLRQIGKLHSLTLLRSTSTFLRLCSYSSLLARLSRKRTRR